MHTKLFVLLLLIFKRCEPRSVSIVVKHQQFFEVQGFRKPDKDPGDAQTAKRPINHLENNINIQNDKSDDEDDIDDDDDDDDDENYDEDEEDELNGTAVGDFVSADLKGHEYSKIDDVNDNNFHIESVSGLKKIFRKKRSAHEQWKSSLPGAEPLKTTDDEPGVWEEVTDADLQKAQMHTYKQVAVYLGWTLLSVVLFAVVGICFLRDPIACIFAFGTGCPCCLICCPCIRSFTDKYLDTKRIVREQLNKYMPGIIVNEDGTLDHYEPTGDELDLLVDIIDEMQD